MKDKVAKKNQFWLNSPDIERRIKRIARQNETSFVFVIRHVLKTYLPEVEKRGLFNPLIIHHE